MTTTARELAEKILHKFIQEQSSNDSSNWDKPVIDFIVLTLEQFETRGRESVLSEIKRMSDEFKACEDNERHLIGLHHEYLYNYLAKLKEPT